MTRSAEPIRPSPNLQNTMTRRYGLRTEADMRLVWTGNIKTRPARP